MKLGVLVGILLLFSVSGVNAQNMVARDAAGNSVALTMKPCVAAPWLKEWKQASMNFENRVYAACWREQNGLIMILDSAGDVTPIPPGAFTRELGV